MDSMDPAEAKLIRLIGDFDLNRKRIVTEEDAKIQLINEMMLVVLG